MKRKNAGFSLVELVVVIAMIGVLSGLTLYGVGQISKYRARECAKNVTSSLTANKVTTLGKAKSTGDVHWELYQKDGNFYVKDVISATDGEVKKLCKASSVIITYGPNGTEKTVSAGDANSLKLCYNRSSGALYDYPAGSSITTVKKIIISGGGRNYVIELVPATGKVKGVN